MIDRLSLQPGQVIEWQFQVERQNFITRYGTAGGNHYKQNVLGGKNPIFPYPIKRIDERVYTMAERLSASLT